MKQTTTKKEKEPIKLREKSLSNGNRSLYLDIYQNGSRSYEFLQMYLVPETSKEAKQRNKETIAAAVAIKSQRIDEIYQGKAGKVVNPWSGAFLIDWMADYKQRKAETSQSNNYAALIQNTINHLERYKGRARMADVDAAFCKGFVTYLKKKAFTSAGAHLSEKAVYDYYLTFSIALNQAEREGVIQANPFHKLDKSEKPINPQSTRTYLTIEEVRSLIESDACREDVKRAFLFACFSGLRISDICSLRWGNLETTNGITRLTKEIVKTRRTLTIKLSSQALRWLPGNRGAADEFIFPLPCLNTICYQLKKWAADANIQKNVSFHTARHTFATMNLTADVDLIVVRDLLGHKDISTTQIYAEIIDKKKEAAVDKVSALFD